MQVALLGHCDSNCDEVLKPNSMTKRLHDPRIPEYFFFLTLNWLTVRDMQSLVASLLNHLSPVSIECMNDKSLLLPFTFSLLYSTAARRREIKLTFKYTAKFQVDF